MPLLGKDKEIIEKMYENISTDVISNSLTAENDVELAVLRLDKIHDQISGNKLFKLKYYLLKAIDENKDIITFGGAYSNHLAACAAAGNLLGIETTGIVRGEEPIKWSATLQYCKEAGMKLQFVSRKEYDNNIIFQEFQQKSTSVIIPEGGYGSIGMQGAAEIKQWIDQKYDHICCAVGTSTTLAGVISVCKEESVTGFNITGNMDDIKDRLGKLFKEKVNDRYIMNEDYSFGGYAKKTSSLIDFMNRLYVEERIPTDFVYTGKMMYGVFDLIKKGYFSKGSKIICLHTGGLQGNLSLPDNTLVY